MLGLFLNVNGTLQAERCTPQHPTVALQRGGYAIVAPFVHAHLSICVLTQTRAHLHTRGTSHCTAGTQPGVLPLSGQGEKSIKHGLSGP